MTSIISPTSQTLTQSDTSPNYSSDRILYTLWLPLNKNDFFSPLSIDHNPLDIGAAAKTIEFFNAYEKTKINKGTLYLRPEHCFFRDSKSGYFSAYAKTLLEQKDDEYSKTCLNYIPEYIQNRPIFINFEDKKILNSLSDKKSDYEIDITYLYNNTPIKIPYITLDIILPNNSNIHFTFIMDAYGFYYFDFPSAGIDEEERLAIIISSFGGDKVCHSLNRNHNYNNDELCKEYLKKYNNEENYFGILTHNQLLLILEGLSNYNLNHKLFFELIEGLTNINAEKLKIMKEYSTKNLIKKIIIKSDENKIKNLLPDLEIDYAKIDIKNSILSRKYDLDYISKLNNEFYINNKSNIINNIITLETNIKKQVENYSSERSKNIKQIANIIQANEESPELSNITYVLILDKIEEMAISKFIETMLSHPYLSTIETGVNVTRKRLTNKMLEFTGRSEIDQVSFNSDYMSFLYNEERLSDYTKLLVAKIPLLLTVDNIMREAYYMKIGNLSDIDYTNDSEQIDQLSAYRSWRNILSTVVENKNTLVGNINAYNQMKTGSDLRELKLL